MLLARIPAAAVGLTAIVLSIASGRNMWQTYQLVSEYHDYAQQRFSLDTIGSTIPSIIQQSHPSSVYQIMRVDDNNVNQSMLISDVVQYLRGLPRRDVVRLFLFDCQPISQINNDEIRGEWEGCLLDNNGWIMNTVTKLLTHGLFGQGQKWLGKSFGTTMTSTATTTLPLAIEVGGVGINRFGGRRRWNESQLLQSLSRSSGMKMALSSLVCRQEHAFDYKIEPGRFHTFWFNHRLGRRNHHRRRRHGFLSATRHPSTDTTTEQEQLIHQQQQGAVHSDSHNPSLVLSYRRHHTQWALFGSMRDELRRLPIPLLSTHQGSNNTKGMVLIGMGAMAWSGGCLNASPFCLWRTTPLQ